MNSLLQSLYCTRYFRKVCYRVICNGNGIAKQRRRPSTKFPRKTITQRRVYHWHCSAFSTICRRRINLSVSHVSKFTPLASVLKFITRYYGIDEVVWVEVTRFLPTT